MLSTDDLLDPTLPTAVPVVMPIAAPVVEVPPVEVPRATARETVRVLHVINGEYYAGAERVQDLLARRLPELGFSVGFACVKLDVFGEMRQSQAAPLFDVSMLSRFDLSAAWRVARIVRRQGYRIIHGHSVRTAMIGCLAAAMTGVPMVYHAHSPASHDTTWPRWNRLNGFVERLSLRGVKRVIAVSQAMAAHVEREGFDPRRIRVVANGVPGVSEAPQREAPCGRWTLGVVALFRPRKGVEVLLDAIHILARQGIPIHVRAVGTFESTQYEAEVAAHVKRLRLGDHITWTGFTRDVSEELRQMDLLVVPSLFGEGLPMVVLEAMASGVPVVATHVAGIPEAIRHGRDGVLVTPGDAEDLARAIADVVGGHYDWSALRTSAFARHARHFSDLAMAEGVAAVYRELLG